MATASGTSFVCDTRESLMLDSDILEFTDMVTGTTSCRRRLGCRRRD